ncbi:hypothetical protein I302_107023 [Kwoniella bestiolae CBS 10118]|uniref:Fcf2 pre-rRNA processing C-terminal domain-containing protein n=1 Tax=Kwoniella bestiolae CBS 10118 TaxID=1296100 RepID=A0A1B9FZQ5_9TREE|nr:hypothetical protein I302_05713 [Kwoniella bestiolae CBS 10118]OCF24254.1 hypothetical protein I302_05713 [Kwoniella bestiolae CBS 10118]
MSTPRRSSRPSTPSSSRPTPTAIRTNIHHHKTADELAAEEVASILHTPTTRLRSAGSATSVGTPIELENGSARALRHRRLNEVREATHESKEREDSKSVASSKSDGDGDGDDASKLLDVSTSGDSTTTEQEITSPSTALTTGQVFARPHDQPEEEDESDEEDDSDDDDGSSTVSASSSSNTSESESESDSEDDSDEERMDKLLEAAKAAAIAKQGSTVNSKGKERASGQEDGEEVLDFDEDQKEKKKDAPIPDLSIPTLPKAHLSFTQDGRAQAFTKLPELAQAGPSKRSTIEGKKREVAAPELDDRPYERELSKREKAAQPRKATTSELWASIPTARSDLLPQMKRDYQALSLANSLDPKRFMKGGSKSDKVPESFAIGTMVDVPRHIQDTTLTKERKYRAGQVVQGLIRDEGTGDYAKRKYGDLQWNRMENGRGKGWKKTKKW